MSIVEDLQVELTKAFGVCDEVDGHDFPARDGEAEYDTRPPGAHTAPTAPFTSASRATRARPEKVSATAFAPRTSHLARCARVYGCGIGSEHDVWVQHREKCGKVTAARGREEGIDNFSLAGAIGVRNRRHSLHPAARAARQLPCRPVLRRDRAS
jgi:hypothetical protein